METRPPDREFCTRTGARCAVAADARANAGACPRGAGGYTSTTPRVPDRSARMAASKEWARWIRRPAPAVSRGRRGTSEVDDVEHRLRRGFEHEPIPQRRLDPRRVDAVAAGLNEDGGDIGAL